MVGTRTKRFDSVELIILVCFLEVKEGANALVFVVWTFVLVITWSEKCDYWVLPSKVVVLLACVVVDEAKKEFGAASLSWGICGGNCTWQKKKGLRVGKRTFMSLSPSGIYGFFHCRSLRIR